LDDIEVENEASKIEATMIMMAILNLEQSDLSPLRVVFDVTTRTEMREHEDEPFSNPR
jgi:hypothetical protein